MKCWKYGRGAPGWATPDTVWRPPGALGWLQGVLGQKWSAGRLRVRVYRVLSKASGPPTSCTPLAGEMARVYRRFTTSGQACRVWVRPRPSPVPLDVVRARKGPGANPIGALLWSWSVSSPADGEPPVLVRHARACPQAQRWPTGVVSSEPPEGLAGGPRQNFQCFLWKQEGFPRDPSFSERGGLTM